MCHAIIFSSMALIVPFRALRPTPASAARVAAVPYDVVNAQEAHALADENPLSFLHVSRAEIDLPARARIPMPMRCIGRRSRTSRRSNVRRRSWSKDHPRLYVYRLKMGNHVQTGIAGTFSIDEYERGVIKKHEHTRRDKEDDRTRHMIELRAQTGSGVPDVPRSSGRSTGLVTRVSRPSAAVRLHRTGRGAAHHLARRRGRGQ